MQSLQDPDLTVAAAAATALGSFSGERVVESLIAVLNVARIDGAVDAAVKVIYQNTSVPERKLLETILDSANLVRVAAIDSLSDIGDKRAVKPLLDLIHDDAEAIHLHAIVALGSIGSLEAVTPLCNFLTSDDVNTVNNILQALIDLKSRDALPFLRAQYQKRPEYRFVLNNAIRAIEAATPGLTKLPRSTPSQQPTTDGLPRIDSTIPERDGRPRYDK